MLKKNARLTNYWLHAVIVRLHVLSSQMLMPVDRSVLIGAFIAQYLRGLLHFRGNLHTFSSIFYCDVAHVKHDRRDGHVQFIIKYFLKNTKHKTPNEKWHPWAVPSSNRSSWVAVRRYYPFFPNNSLRSFGPLGKTQLSSKWAVFASHTFEKSFDKRVAFSPARKPNLLNRSERLSTCS